MIYFLITYNYMYVDNIYLSTEQHPQLMESFSLNNNILFPDESII